MMRLEFLSFLVNPIREGDGRVDEGIGLEVALMISPPWHPHFFHSTIQYHVVVLTWQGRHVWTRMLVILVVL